MADYSYYCLLLMLLTNPAELAPLRSNFINSLSSGFDINQLMRSLQVNTNPRPLSRDVRKLGQDSPSYPLLIPISGGSPNPDPNNIAIIQAPSYNVQPAQPWYPGPTNSDSYEPKVDYKLLYDRVFNVPIQIQPIPY